MQSNTEERGPRPAMVTALGWIWICLGAAGTLMSLFVLVMWVVITRVAPGEVESFEGFEGFSVAGAGVIEWVFAHFGLVVTVEVLFAVLTCVAGIELLRLRRWARAFLEGVSWLSLISLLAFGVLWIYLWTGMIGMIPADDPNAPPPGMVAGFGIGMMAMVVLFYGTPTAILIYFMRHRTVRQAVGRPRVEPA